MDAKPYLMQTVDGQITEPYSISAGLIIQELDQCMHIYTKQGRAEFYCRNGRWGHAGRMELSKLEGIIPAIESSHAFAILETRKFKTRRCGGFNLSGRGD